MDKTRIIPKQAHADLKETSENKQLLMLNKENSLLLGDQSTLTAQVTISTLDTIPVRNLPSHSAAFLQKSLKDPRFYPTAGKLSNL